MSDDAETIITETEDTGGPKKSFWGHLDDLRKVLIRCAIAIGIALVLSLVFTNKLMYILEYPLQRMAIFEKAQSSASFQIGDKTFGPFHVNHDQFSPMPAGSATHQVYKLDTVKVGDDLVLGLKLVSEGPAKSDLNILLKNLGPTEAFMVAFHVSLCASVILSSPFWLYYVAQFILPALHLRERKALATWMGWSLGLFLTGVLFTYFYLLPIALRASIEYSNLMGFSATEWRATEYIGFTTKFILGMGLGFQFPLIILILVKLGVLTHKTLAKYRRHVFVLCFILGAVLTTPEVITQVAMAVPLYVLYEVSIWIAWYWERKKRKAEQATYSESQSP